jgi:hypothetical protein
LLSVSACVDEDKEPFNDFQRGAIPIFAQNSDDTGFIDYLDLSASNLSFTVDKQGVAAVNSIDVTITYNNSQTGSSETAVLTTVTSFPATVTVTRDNLLTAFAPEVATADSISVGDSFVFGGNVKLADGTYLTGGYSPSIFANNTVSLTYNVACQSDLGGVLDYETTVYTAGPFGHAENCVGVISGQVEFEDLGGGQYAISDITFGQYDCAWDDSPAVGVTLVDICNVLSLTGADQYGLIYSISIVSNDGTDLVIDWENDYGDTGRTTLKRTDGKSWPLGLSTN